MTALTAAKIPDAVQEKLIALGYESSEAFQFKDEGVLEAFLQHFLVTEKAVDNASETTWAFHPLVGKFKALWKNIMASRKSAPAPTADVDTAAQLNGNSGLVTALVGCNQSLSVVDPMRRDLEKKYTGTVLTLSSLPSMSLLNTIHAQKDCFLEALAFGAGFCEDQWDKELSAGPFQVQNLLQIRANAYSMVGACHLGSWSLYSNKFLEYYTKDVGENFRFPNVIEAEEADQQAVREIFSLCFNGASLDDAIATVVMDRDMLRQLLFLRPKLTLKPRDREPLKRSRPVEKPKPDTKKVRNGECFNWHEGKCKSRACKFQHACAQCVSEKHHVWDKADDCDFELDQALQVHTSPWKSARENLQLARSLMMQDVEAGFAYILALWTVFYNFDSASVRTSADSVWTCALFQNAVAVQQNLPLRCVDSPDIPCVADAFADSSGAGIGGWWATSMEPVQQDQVFWFSLPLDKTNLPHWLICKHLQSYIASFEALAQLLLLLGRVRGMERPFSYLLRLRQLCDNAGVAACTRKQLTLKLPLTYILQAISFHAIAHGVQLTSAHCAGERNEWADALSRGNLSGFAPSRRITFDLADILSAPWLASGHS
ncbi:Protein lap1 [Durusdinium trenchii]|uniref:Protein lap1 n=1 Tax=Durusdinium trenchii TaxID=1381693 RepID=A0ABP0JVE5_9DINO